MSLSSCVDFVRNLFGASDGYTYEALHKKNDDLSLEISTQWALSHPVDKNLSKLSTEDIQKYVDSFIQDLKKIPINSSNINVIKSHLAEIGKQSNRVRELFIQKFSKLKCEENLIKDLKAKLIFVYTEKP